MGKAKQKDLAAFWDKVTEIEAYIRQYGHMGWRSQTEELWRDDFAAAYEKIAPMLVLFANKRVFPVPSAPGMNPFQAETAHQALLFLLNPPEAFFGYVQALGSTEYLAIKNEAQREYVKLAGRNAAGDIIRKRVTMKPQGKKLKLFFDNREGLIGYMIKDLVLKLFGNQDYLPDEKIWRDFWPEEPYEQEKGGPPCKLRGLLCGARRQLGKILGPAPGGNDATWIERLDGGYRLCSTVQWKLFNYYLPISKDHYREKGKKSEIRVNKCRFSAGFGTEHENRAIFER